MKTTLFSTVLTVIVGVLLTVVSCKNSTVSPTPTPGPTTTGDLRISAPFANQTTQFAFDITKRVTTEEGVAKNVFISPLSLHMALGMILNGADGQTAQEIQKTLHLDAQTLAEANQTYQNLLVNLPKADPKVQLILANSVWYRSTFPVEVSFQNLLKQSFDATVSAEDFNSPATVGKINNWASEKTNGKIPKVISQIQSNDVMFLLNALYFKGDWTTQFNPGKTIDAPFTLASGTTTNVQMMRNDLNINMAFRPTYGAYELPYGSGQFAMTVLLPTENLTADALINNLTGEEWNQLQKDMKLGNVDFGLPKFTLNYEIMLNRALSALGMPMAFTELANFSKLSKQGGLALSFVKQNTFVAVDEKGTEAAAVTTGGVTTTSVKVPTLCDRPFVFIIHEKTTGTILFTGKMADPTKANQ